MASSMKLLGLLREAVADSLTPETGAVLSGGIDSSTITMLARSRQDIPTSPATTTGSPTTSGPTRA